MAIKATIGIQVDGATDAARELRTVTDQLQRTTNANAERRSLRFRQSLAALSRQERQESFARLSDEQKLSRLTERRLFLERQLVRAQQQGNAYRAGALRLSLANVAGQTAGLGPTGLSRYLGMAGAQAKGFLGGIGLPMMGGMGVAGIGVATAMLLRSLERASIQAATFADNLEDTADMIGLAPAQFAALQKSALAAGVPGRMVYSAVGKLRSEMASAHGGDPAALARFKHYGVSPDQLRGGDVLGIGKAIRGSLGSGGMTPAHENDLRAFFGGRPGMALKIFGDLKASAMSDDEIRRVAAFGSAREEVQARVEETALKQEAAGNRLRAWWTRTYASLPFQETMGASALVKQREREATARAAAGLPPTGQVTGEGVAPFNADSIAKKSDPSALAGRPTIDALMRIGLFRGGTEARQLGILRDHSAKLNDIVTQLKKLNSEVAAE